MRVTFSRNEDCEPATLAAISAFVERYGVSLPEDYREFLLTINGGSPSPCDQSLCPGGGGDFVAFVYGLQEGEEWKRLEYAIESFGHDLSAFLPIAIANGGNYFLLKLIEPDRGAVYYWDSDQEDPDVPTFESVKRAADSFAAWLENLKDPDDAGR